MVIYLPDQDRTIDVDPPPLLADPDSFLVPIVRRANLSFDGRGGTQQSGIFAAGIDASPWRSGALVLVLHARNNWGALGAGTALFTISVRSVRLDPEQPELEFVDNASVVATGVVDRFLAVPSFGVTALTAPYGPQLRVGWTWTQGPTPATAALTLVCSVYLLGRRA